MLRPAKLSPSPRAAISIYREHTMAKTEFQVLKGTRDFLPSQYIPRKRVIRTIEETFELFGFEPMETPALEYAETLREKYGEEGDRLMYTFTDRGGRNVALRYDLTVPLARTMAMYQVDKPFRRYQISPVWRADKPQKGRYREFWQCDVDIIGSREVWADAEILGVTYHALNALGFKHFTMRINKRKLLNGIARYGGLADEAIAVFFRSIDKADKIGWDGVRDELTAKEFSVSLIDKIFALLKPEEGGKETLRRLKNTLHDSDDAREGIAELEEIQRCLLGLDVPATHFTIDVSLVRGLDYYTGPIYETIVDEPKIGSISGGGRYDTLIGLFGGADTPATGGSLGLERIITSMEELGMMTDTATVTQVLVTLFDQSSADASMNVVAELRRSGVNAEVYIKNEKLKRQLAYADRKGIPLVVIVGPEEVEHGTVVLRDMRSKAQLTLGRGVLTEKVRELLTV